jgi:Lar family restriction alleviation protein
MKFEEVLPALREGRRIKRRSFSWYLGPNDALEIEHILADDWEIVENVNPCPFCGGGKNKIVNRYTPSLGFYVYCCNCETAGPRGRNREEAIAKWNAAPREER